jgi:hypothetical protein
MISNKHILQYVKEDVPFTIYLTDGRKFLVKDRHWISTHPSGQSSTIIVYGPDPGSFDLISLLAITSIGRNGSKHSK